VDDASAPTPMSLRDIYALDQLTVDAMRSLYRLELGGESFYAALAEHFGDPEVAQLFRRNGREEAGHARRLGRAIGHKLGVDFEPTPEMLQTRPARLPDDCGIEFLHTLVEGERDGEGHYARWAANEPDAEVAKLFRLSGREESIHGDRVSRAITILERTDA
jgi:rubrerythrin